MARSDLLISLIRAGTAGDAKMLRQAAEAIAAEERAKQHHVLADELEQILRQANGEAKRLFAVQRPSSELWHEITPRKSFDDLILPAFVATACRQLVDEQDRVDLLRAHNLEPRNRVLLAGPPGNGKTSVAEAIAHALLVPLLVVRYDAIIGSYLGETASRLNKVFDHVRTRHCVLFFDEFDTLGKERGDAHDMGEVKRVVSSLLLQIDDVPSHVVVVTATNHPELLDRAVWRRFQLRCELPMPTFPQIIEWLKRMEHRYQISFARPHRQLASAFRKVSFAEIEEFGLSVARRIVLSGPKPDVKKIVAEQLRQWQERYSL